MILKGIFVNNVLDFLVILYIEVFYNFIEELIIILFFLILLGFCL